MSDIYCHLPHVVDSEFVVGPSGRGLGTLWWRLGDLSQDLVGKKALPYSDDWWNGKGEDGEEDGKLTPAEDWVNSEGDNVNLV